ncbi:chorismate-binding protein [Thermobifida halotolerans]|uniref:anthranilate synthase n=1 Tax=Thermobifida halotolerans TaxID=483545 RepID=A0A399FZN8_9ACTN|nr:chorismate-binding protein [Thermobifida halotolerans]UOE21262.1 chorismate-binding protein [Thermobifida halotolerans]
MNPPAADHGHDLLDRILAAPPPAFALLHRAGGGTPGTVDVLTGEVTQPATLADIPLTGPRPPEPKPAHDALVLIPYRQIAERGFTVPDDGAPLVAMVVTEQSSTAASDVVRRIPDVPIRLDSNRFDVDDAHYAATVRRVVADEIGTGEGANFVIKRSFLAEVGDYSPHVALSLFRRLLEREQGAYWTFVVHTPERTLVGATPERHVSLEHGVAAMNPISGTYRYPPTGPTLRGITEFIADRKETDELYMVVDEELKMMARICDTGGRVSGPHLRQMARLAHTEYLIEGRSSRDVREILRETMFAPTVTGSPLENATRVIRRHEPEGRGYYSGVAALIGRDADGERTLDSAILIRTAEITPSGRMRIAVGATLVRHSDPRSEAEETRAKADGLLTAMRSGADTRFADHPEVRAALRRRNTGIADFWLRDGGRVARVDGLVGVEALVVDAEDTFTAMIGHQLRALGLSVTVRRFDEPYDPRDYDLVVLGPGPGDPRAATDPRIAHLRSVADLLLDTRHPFLAVCLSHQVLSLRLGFALLRRDAPDQGVQREIDLFGARERVGFYNTFVAHSTEDKREVDGVGLVEVSRCQASGEVHALRGPHFVSLQFHAESVLTVDGPRILARTIRGVLGR